tara:strand:- start:656 stop:1828 length:1173 start_codon:yes stop_codon:yes gene_type:complete
MEFIDLKAQQNQLTSKGIPLREEIDKRIQVVLNHGKYILGPEVKELEQKLAKFVGVKHCVGVSSGTDALLIALMALGIKRGDEVITTPFSFFATAETIMLLGAKPVFIDIDRDTYNLDHRNLKSAINKKTKAIMPVSLYGQPANFLEINKIAERYKIPVIEDGAQSFGSTHHNKRSCGLSTIGTTSFFPSKPLGGYGDGGACFTDNNELAKKMRILSLHGQEKRYSHVELGINGRLDTIQAAILLAKLDIFEHEIAARQKIGQRYNNEFQKLGFTLTPKIAEDNTSVFAQYTIQVENRNKVIQKLKEINIPTAIHYPSLITNQKALNNKKSFFNNLFKNLSYKKTYLKKSLNNAENISQKVLSLPMYPLLKQSDQDTIISSVIDTLNSSD